MEKTSASNIQCSKSHANTRRDQVRLPVNFESDFDVTSTKPRIHLRRLSSSKQRLFLHQVAHNTAISCELPANISITSVPPIALVPPPQVGPRSSSAIMCYHEYTHFPRCEVHVPMHTHMCPKNVMNDQTRAIFCEDYQIVQVKTTYSCPHCEIAQSVTTPTSSNGRLAYPTPPKTGTPGSAR
ncbi:hypothetical protein AC578_3542 [Pseudocercospora eumusae]|uniref:Uncharacterized protein n=1 Tax=Pseudocercospora eumusae TaxID=321146 RepID=A0A139GW79_9PEZI|nr:hypothetical protein AC578_3542 [Pseudocercospora eumusae]